MYIKNEILGIMAKFIQRQIADIAGKWFTIMVDDTCDLTNTEQVGFLYYICNKSSHPTIL